MNAFDEIILSGMFGCGYCKGRMCSKCIPKEHTIIAMKRKFKTIIYCCQCKQEGELLVRVANPR
jgi:hypothetical protein